MAVSFEDWAAITELKARYCRFLDTKQWDKWRNLFTEDYVLDVSQESGMAPIEGRDAAIDSVLSFIRDAITAHQVHTPEISVDGDTAEVIWPMQDRVIFGPDRSICGYGHYHEQLRRVAGQWKIARLKLTRLHIDALPGTVLPQRG